MPFLTAIYRNRKDRDSNLNKPQNNRSTNIYRCPGQQWAGVCWCSGPIWGLVTNDQHSSSHKIQRPEETGCKRWASSGNSWRTWKSTFNPAVLLVVSCGLSLSRSLNWVGEKGTKYRMKNRVKLQETAERNWWQTDGKTPCTNRLEEGTLWNWPQCPKQPIASMHSLLKYQ